MTALAVPHDLFRAISDPTRRAILDLLREGERSVGEIHHAFDVTMSAISQHLRVLLDAGLVVQRRAGRERIYRLEAAPLREVADWLSFYEPFWEERLDALGGYLDRAATAEQTKGED
jgi:DNA-binding transcriptional ArsR family regulator